MSTAPPIIATDGAHGPELLPAKQATRHSSTAIARKARKRKDPVQWLMGTIDDIASQGSRFYEQRIRNVLKMLENRHFVRGEQMTVFDWNRWQFNNQQFNRRLSYSEQMLLTTNNRLAPAYAANLKEVMASNPAFTANARNDKPDKAAAARVGQSYIQYYQDRNQKPSLVHEAAAYQMQCGNVFTETFYDKDAGGIVDLPDWLDDVIAGDEAYNCPACGQTGPVNALAQNGQAPQPSDMGGMQVLDTQCPGCQASPLAYQKNPDTQVKIPISVPVHVGAVIKRNRDPIGIIVDYTKKTINESTFLYEESAVTRHELEAAYAWATIPSAPLSEALRAQLALERSTGANSIPTATWVGNEAMSGSAFELIRYERCWLEPALYAGLETDSALTVGEGPQAFTIPANKLFSDLFPDGLRVYKVADCILNLANEKKNDRWAHYAWIKNTDSTWGDDLISPLVQLQKRYNELDSLEMQSNMANASPTLIYDRDRLDLSSWNANPVTNSIAMNEQAPGAGIKGQLFEIIEPLPIAEQVVQQKDHLAADILYLANAQPIPHDTQDQQVKTATEAAISRDMQVGLIGPPMELRAEGNITALYQALKLCQRYFIPGQYPFMGMYQDYEIAAFLACDIERDIEITYSPGSHIPRTTQDVKLNALALLQLGNVPGGVFNPQMIPDDEIRSQIIELFGNPFDLDKIMPDKRNAEKRLQFLQEIVLQQVPKMKILDINAKPPQPMPGPDGQPTNPAFMLYQQTVQETIAVVPFQPLTDDLGTIAKVYVKWMKTDDGVNAPPFLQQCVLALIQQAQGAVTQAAQQAKQQQLEDATHAGILNAAPKLLETALRGDQEIEKAQVIHGQETALSAQEHDQNLQAMAMQQAHESNMQQADADNQSDDSGGEEQ